MTNTGFIEVYVSATGEKVRVPEHWVNHPVLWRGFRKTPRTVAVEGQNQEVTTTNAAQPADTERK